MLIWIGILAFYLLSYKLDYLQGSIKAYNRWKPSSFNLLQIFLASMHTLLHSYGQIVTKTAVELLCQIINPFTRETNWNVQYMGLNYSITHLALEMWNWHFSLTSLTIYVYTVSIFRPCSTEVPVTWTRWVTYIIFISSTLLTPILLGHLSNLNHTTNSGPEGGSRLKC